MAASGTSCCETRAAGFSRDARLTHPSVQRLLDAHVDAALPYLLYEYIEGPTLAQLLAEEGALAPDDVVRLGMQILRLQPALLAYRHALDDCAFGNAPAAMLAEHAEVEQHVAVEVIAHKETEAAGGVEPFHPSDDRRQFRCGKGVVRVHFGLGLPFGSSRCNAYHGVFINTYGSVGKPTLTGINRG